MATAFTGRVLGILDRIFHFGGGSSLPSKVELDLPIQVVHDVSRQSELGAGIGKDDGYFIHQSNVLHVGPTTERYQTDPWETVAAITTIHPMALSLWLIYPMIFTQTGVLTRADVAMRYPLNFTGMPPAINDHPFRVIEATTTVVPVNNFNDTGDRNIYMSADGFSVRGLSQPVYFPRGAIVTVVETANNIIGIVDLLMWLGPRGARPPGMG